MAEAENGPLADALRRGPILLDAAMGTRLIARGLDPSRGDDPCLWNLARPDDVLAVHRLDIAAGSDALLTNTFGANRRWLTRLGRGDEVRAINARAVALARDAAAGRLVIGSIGPTADAAAAAEQIDALDGVDAILFETLGPSGPPVEGLGGLPIIASYLDEAEIPPGVVAVGCNCLDLGATAGILESLADKTALPLLAKPSAGLPGGPMNSPADFAAAVPGWLRRGVRLMGGCCGATERHIAALRRAIDRG